MMFQMLERIAFQTLKFYLITGLYYPLGLIKDIKTRSAKVFKLRYFCFLVSK